MIQGIEAPPSEQQQRLAAKTQDQRMVTEFVQGAGLSPWAARVAVQTVHEVYFAEPTGQPLRAGQIRYECVRKDQGAGKPLKECALTAVVLTLIEPGDATLRAQSGAEAHRRHVLARLAEEAREQGGLLTQEDLAQLLFTDVRTIRRDIRFFKEHGGVMIPTRGQQKDIGPTVTHKGVAVRLWIEEAKEPQQVALYMHHSLNAVERYLGHFARVVYLAGLGFDTLQTAFTIGISSALVRTYRALYDHYKGHPGFKNRLAELKAIGEAHYEMADQKKGRYGPCPASSNSARSGGRP